MVQKERKETEGCCSVKSPCRQTPPPPIYFSPLQVSHIPTDLTDKFILLSWWLMKVEIFISPKAFILQKWILEKFPDYSPQRNSQ